MCPYFLWLWLGRLVWRLCWVVSLRHNEKHPRVAGRSASFRGAWHGRILEGLQKWWSCSYFCLKPGHRLIFNAEETLHGTIVSRDTYTTHRCHAIFYSTGFEPKLTTFWRQGQVWLCQRSGCPTWWRLSRLKLFNERSHATWDMTFLARWDEVRSLTFASLLVQRPFSLWHLTLSNTRMMPHAIENTKSTKKKHEYSTDPSKTG